MAQSDPPSRLNPADSALHSGWRDCRAVGRALDEREIALAVVASIRHEDTDYDELLMTGTARADAKTRIKPAIDRVLAAWSTGDAPGPGPERDGQDHAADQRRTSPA